MRPSSSSSPTGGAEGVEEVEEVVVEVKVVEEEEGGTAADPMGFLGTRPSEMVSPRAILVT